VDRTIVPFTESDDLQPLDRIQSRGRLRIAYIQDSLPFAYLNSHDRLVGFDVDMANQLAADMGVTLEFVPISRSKLEEQWNQSGCDILMSGFAITAERAEHLLLTSTYLDEHMAFLTMDYRRSDFLSRDSIHKLRELKIGTPNIPYYISKLHEYAPDAKIVVLDSVFAELSKSLDGLDAIVTTAERGSTWTLLELKKKDGTINQLYDYWILGKNAERTKPRWSVARNVLHWIQ
jgi:ABC-type amino acid transport substrate-binding protein